MKEHVILTSADFFQLWAPFKEIMGAVWASASASHLQSRCGDRQPAPVAASALSPLGLSEARG